MNEKVENRKEFIDSIEKMSRDLRENPENWENKSLEDFLEAVARYTVDIQGYYDNTKQNIDVQMFAK